MANPTPPELSVVVPVYNERPGIELFHADLTAVLKAAVLHGYEIIYCDDGSTDGTTEVLRRLARNRAVRLIRLSRNFGKEIAATAAIHAARGQAVLMLDADGQHPVTAIPRFLSAWRQGAPVVIGRRRARRASPLKRFCSKLFYKLFRRLTGIAMDPAASDFRLIDRRVQSDFNRLQERSRITRGLIDWLGYERQYVSYDENPRVHGTSPYSFRKLCKLAIDSVISHSNSPLYLVAYVGAVVLPLSLLLGVGMLVNFLARDPLHLHATGGAYMMVFMLFLVGILLVSQGVIGLYLSHIHAETQNRPLYIIDTKTSKGL